MNTPTIALSLDSIDRTGIVQVVPQQQPRRVLLRRPAARPLQQSANLIAVVAIAPLALAATAALMFVLTAKLLFALVAVGFES